MPEKARVFIDLHGCLLVPPNSAEMNPRFYVKDHLTEGEKGRIAQYPEYGKFSAELTKILMPPYRPPTFVEWLAQIRRGDLQQSILDYMPGPQGPIVMDTVAERSALRTRGFIMGSQVSTYSKDALDSFEVNQGLAAALKKVSLQRSSQVTICSNLSYLLAQRLKGKLGEFWSMLDSNMPAILRPLDVNPSSLLKVAASALRSGDEEVYFIEDDIYLAEELRKYCKGVYVPLTIEQVQSQPLLQQDGLRRILKEGDKRVIFKEQSFKNDLEHLLNM